MILRARQHTLEFPRRTMVMGSVRLAFLPALEMGQNPLSAALDAARGMERAGADIIALDLDGFPECPTDSDVKLAVHVVSAFIQSWKQEAHPLPLSLSVPSSLVARAVLTLGGDFLRTACCADSPEFINCAALCAENGAGLMAQYAVPCGLEAEHDSFDAVRHASEAFEKLLQGARRAGLPDDSLILGVRLDWRNKYSSKHSMTLSAQINRLQRFGRPLLLSEPPAHGDFSENQTAGMVARVVHSLMCGVSVFHGPDVGAITAVVRTIGGVLE
jgi:dihydropteroate synthase